MRRMSWSTYLKKCEELCPKQFSMWVLGFTINFYWLYQAKIAPEVVMHKLEQVAKLDLTPDERVGLVHKLAFNEVENE